MANPANQNPPNPLAYIPQTPVLRSNVSHSPGLSGQPPEEQKEEERSSQPVVPRRSLGLRFAPVGSQATPSGGRRRHKSRRSKSRHHKSRRSKSRRGKSRHHKSRRSKSHRRRK